MVLHGRKAVRRGPSRSQGGLSQSFTVARRSVAVLHVICNAWKNHGISCQVVWVDCFRMSVVTVSGCRGVNVSGCWGVSVSGCRGVNVSGCWGVSVSGCWGRRGGEEEGECLRMSGASVSGCLG